MWSSVSPGLELRTLGQLGQSATTGLGYTQPLETNESLVDFNQLTVESLEVTKEASMSADLKR